MLAFPKYKKRNKGKPKRAPSILQSEKYCYITYKCFGVKVNVGLECHHIYYGCKNRQISDENGFWVYLHPLYHKNSNIAVHCKDGAALDKELKEDCRKAYLAAGHSQEEFYQLVGKNYLDSGSGKTDDAI